jgi:hypothetical protein
VVNRTYVPKTRTNYNGHDIPIGMFLVGGGRGRAGVSSEARERGIGYVYHNTLVCPPGGGFERFLVADFPQGLKNPEQWFQSRNNLATTEPIRKVANVPINDFFGDKVVSDFDLFTGALDRSTIGGKSNRTGKPTFRDVNAGDFRLRDESLGRAVGTPIPNFTPPFTGAAPDLGACQSSSSPVVFGTKRWKPTPANVTATTAGVVRFERDQHRLKITINREEFATYVTRDPKILRPYFENLFAPGHVRVTRNHPPKPNVDALDHDTIHPGVWLGIGNLNGRDYWRNKARVEHVKYLVEPHGETKLGRFAVENRWLGPDGKAVAREECQVDLLVRSQGTLLVYDSTFHPVERELVFGDEKVGVFGVRLATPLIGEKGGRIQNSRGHETEKAAFGQEADWCDYSAISDRGRTGVVVMCDPANTLRSRFLVREYGVVAANPFGGQGLGGGAPTRVVVPVTHSLRLRFAAFLYSGDIDPRVVFADFRTHCAEQKGQ